MSGLRKPKRTQFLTLIGLMSGSKTGRMDWILYALGTALALAAADFCVKLAAGKLSNSVALLLYGSCTFLTGLGWVLWQRAHGVPQHAQTACCRSLEATNVLHSVTAVLPVPVSTVGPATAERLRIAKATTAAVLTAGVALIVALI